MITVMRFWNVSVVTRHTPQLYATKRLPRSEEVPWETAQNWTNHCCLVTVSTVHPLLLWSDPSAGPSSEHCYCCHHQPSPAPSCGLRINKSPRAEQQLLRRSSILQSERNERIISGLGNNNNTLHNGYCCSHKLILTRPWTSPGWQVSEVDNASDIKYFIFYISAQ